MVRIDDRLARAGDKCSAPHVAYRRPRANRSHGEDSRRPRAARSVASTSDCGIGCCRSLWCRSRQRDARLNRTDFLSRQRSPRRIQVQRGHGREWNLGVSDHPSGSHAGVGAEPSCYRGRHAQYRRTSFRFPCTNLPAVSGAHGTEGAIAVRAVRLLPRRRRSLLGRDPSGRGAQRHPNR